MVVVTWNGAHLLDDCLRGLAAQTVEHRVVVVDNGSADDTAAVLANYDVDVVRLPKNIGFAGGANAGVARARTEWVALLNNDAVPRPDWLERLDRGAGVAVPDVGFLASTLTFPDSDVVDSAGDEIDRAFTAAPRGHGRSLSTFRPRGEKYVGACGGAAAYRVDMWRQLGGFSEPYFAYLEDADLCLRAFEAGWRGSWIPEARVEHRLSATSARIPGFKRYQGVRNSWFLFVRCVPRGLVPRALPLHLLAHLVWFVAAIKAGELQPLLRAWRDACRATPRLWRERRVVQAARSRPVAEIWEALSPTRELARFSRARAEQETDQ